MPPEHNVVVVGGGSSTKWCVELLVKKSKASVTVIQANSFVEWPLAIPVVLVHPEIHDRAVAPDGQIFQVPGAVYDYGTVTNINPEKKTISMKNGAVVKYDAIVVATGFDFPLIYPAKGGSITARKEEIQKVATAIQNASTVVVNGGGLVALEIAGNIKGAYPTKRVILLCRGLPLESMSKQHADKAKVGLHHMDIELLSNAPVDLDVPKVASFDHGSFEFDNNEISYDAFIPAYSRGPNTDFFRETYGVLDASGRIQVNRFMQTWKYEEIFAIGCNNAMDSLVTMPKLRAQAKTVAENVHRYLNKMPLLTHKANQMNNNVPFVRVGSGKSGWAFVHVSALPHFVRCCYCNGLAGFPFCPPPCCWCWYSPLTFGYCCGPCEGQGASETLEALTFKTFEECFPGGSKGPEISRPSQEIMNRSKKTRLKNLMVS